MSLATPEPHGDTAVVVKTCLGIPGVVPIFADLVGCCRFLVSFFLVASIVCYINYELYTIVFDSLSPALPVGIPQGLGCRHMLYYS